MVTAIIVTCLLIFMFFEFLVLGKYFVWGPIRSYQDYKDDIKDIKNLYPVKENQNNIIFYGADNFANWHSMDGDVKGFVIQNHSLRSCIDADLIKYLKQLVIPYNPKVVFVLTSSNDFMALTGFNNERTTKMMKYKKQLFEKIHEELPNTKIVVTSALYLPGRVEFISLTKKINQELLSYCNKNPFMEYLDCDNLTYEKETFKKELFEKDMLVLNRDGQMAFANDYIIPCLEDLRNNNVEI